MTQQKSGSISGKVTDKTTSTISGRVKDASDKENKKEDK